MIKKHTILIIPFFLLFTPITKSQGTVTDIDGNTYRTVSIGNQVWMAENLRTTRYNDGTTLLSGLPDDEWAITTEGAYAVYPHGNVKGIYSKAEMVKAYGKLYNWYSVVDESRLCPKGWRVPSDDDWRNLVFYLIATYNLSNEWEDIKGIGNALKSYRQVETSPFEDYAGNLLEHPRWNYSHNHYGTDKFNFSALPAGGRYSKGVFSHIGNAALWWSSTEKSNTHAWGRSIGYYHGGIYRFSAKKNIGFSVRCLQN